MSACTDSACGVDSEVEYFESGFGDEVMGRAAECSHGVYNWSLDGDEDVWEKKCVFCPAVLEVVDADEKSFE